MAKRIKRDFLGDCDRYGFDVRLKADDGWQQYDTDQDAWYFGCWVNPVSFQTVTYAEGDFTLVTVDTAEEFNQEIKEMNEFYGEGFICKAYSENADGTWSKEVCRQDRNEFYAEVA